MKGVAGIGHVPQPRRGLHATPFASPARSTQVLRFPSPAKDAGAGKESVTFRDPGVAVSHASRFPRRARRCFASHPQQRRWCRKGIGQFVTRRGPACHALRFPARSTQVLRFPSPAKDAACRRGNEPHGVTTADLSPVFTTRHPGLGGELSGVAARRKPHRALVGDNGFRAGHSRFNHPNEEEVAMVWNIKKQGRSVTVPKQMAMAILLPAPAAFARVALVFPVVTAWSAIPATGSAPGPPVRNRYGMRISVLTNIPRTLWNQTVRQIASVSIGGGASACAVKRVRNEAAGDWRGARCCRRKGCRDRRGIGPGTYLSWP